MSDVCKRSVAPSGTDALYQQWVIVAAQACTGWATAQVDGRLDLLLWPHAADAVPGAVPLRVDTAVVQRGVWRVTLCAAAALPPGVDLDTRHAVVRAERTLDGMQTPFLVIDQVVQVGLFGEVLYR